MKINGVNNVKLGKSAVRFSWSLFRYALLLGVSFIIMYPIIYMLSMSFRSPADIFDPSVIWVPKNFTLENFQDIWQLMEYPKTVIRTLLLNLGSSIIQVFTCAITAYGFARFNFRYKNLLFALVVFSILIPSQIISIPLFVQFCNFDFFGIGSLIGLFTGQKLYVNLIDSPMTFFLPALFGAGIKSGLFIFIYRQFFRGLPKELEDAAAIDGCGFVSCFFRIIVPNSIVFFVTVFILSFVWYWNDYFTSSMLMRNEKTISLTLAILPALAKNFVGDIAYDPYKVITLMQAGCLMSILPVLVLYTVLQRFFVQGVERSGIVG